MKIKPGSFNLPLVTTCIKNSNDLYYYKRGTVRHLTIVILFHLVKKTQPSAVGGNTANSKGNFRIILLQPCFLDLKLCEIVIIMWKGGILFCCCRYVSPQPTVYVHYLYKDCTYWNEIWYRCKFNSNNHSFRSLSL